MIFFFFLLTVKVHILNLFHTHTLHVLLKLQYQSSLIHLFRFFYLIVTILVHTLLYIYTRYHDTKYNNHNLSRDVMNKVVL